MTEQQKHDLDHLNIETPVFSTIGLTIWESTVVGMLFLMLLTIVFVAGWSGVLLFIGAEEGGGPLGWTFRAVIAPIMNFILTRVT